MMAKNYLKRPDWLKVSAFAGDEYHQIRKRLRDFTLLTVCEEANCPNRGECFNSGTATFLLMGAKCTRNCRFCNISAGKPDKLDVDEPQKIARMAKLLNLKHVVITSVTRDDLPDHGAGHFARTVNEVRLNLPQATIEILIPDFHARPELLDIVLLSKPKVFNHNIETVSRLYSNVRPQADYRRSLKVLEYAAINYPNVIIKSGIMVGLGESKDEIHQLFHDATMAGVEVLTIGQYLSPSKHHAPIRKYYTPEEFKELSIKAKNCRLKKVVSGPLVRSSYRAGKALPR